MRYHYTTGHCVTKILAEGFIRPATAFVPKCERPIVWFTCAEKWEGTANKGIIENGRDRTLSQAETEKMCGGLYRIGVSDDLPGLHNFLRITRESRQHPAITRELIATATKEGSHPETDWFGTLFPVPTEKFTVIEKWDGAQRVDSESGRGLK
jgi:hypothetical protein